MKAAPFDYVRADCVADAIAAFRGCGGDARYLAGGQSLLAAMNLRLQTPSLLIDLARIESMRGIELRGDELRVGALTRHAEVLSSPLIARHVPLLAAAAPWVAHPAIRNKGTLGGSLALADPASEFPAVALALDASIELDSGEHVRRVKASDFFLDLYETAIEPGEILTAIWFPCARRDERFAFGELARRRGDYALAGVAMAAQFRDEVIDDIRIVFLSVGRTPLRASAAEAALTGQRFTDQAIRACRVAVAQDLIDSSEDVQTSAAARRHLAGVLLERQLDGLRRETAA